MTLKRTPFKPPELKSCEGCGNDFMQTRSMQFVCSMMCASKLVRRARTQETMQTRIRKEAMKSLRELLADAQVAFNAFIRARDAGKPCICCGKPFEPNKPGGSMDAGHYLSRGASPQHRFNENNVFGQRKNCNRPGGASRDAFRAGVLARIGQDALEALERDNRVHKWTADELRSIRATYRAKRKELRATA
jgi:hypothetical protein